MAIATAMLLFAVSISFGFPITVNQILACYAESVVEFRDKQVILANRMYILLAARKKYFVILRNFQLYILRGLQTDLEYDNVRFLVHVRGSK